ncbi:MAG TPA: AAA family ATPase [Neobacillus sp.]
MRINLINIRAFGHFTDYELLFDQAKNFHLIYGPNEAGKSTALRSINHFLYGFPSQTNDSFLHSNSKLRIEGQLINSMGETLQFSRRKGNKNTVLDASGNALNEDLVNTYLNGLSEQHFLNMFALDHVRLREGGESLMQSGGNLGESLFSAASGMSMLRKVFDELEKKSADIYKKRASTTKLNRLLKEEKELIKEISDYQLKIQAWKELERKYNDGKKEINTMINQVKMLRKEQELLHRVKLTLPKIAMLKDQEQKLADLGDVPNLPDNIEELRKESQQKLEAARKEKKRAEDESLELDKELKLITIPEGLIEQSTLIDALYREVQGYQNNLKQIPLLDGERKQLEERVLSFMKEIDSNHADLEKIDLFRLSLEKKATIRQLCKEKPLLDQELEKNLSELNEISEDLQKKAAEHGEMTDLPEIEGLADVIDRVKRAGQIEESLKTLLNELGRRELQINEEIRFLPQWEGTYQELMVLSVPSLTETVNKFEQKRTDVLQKLQKTEEQIRDQKLAIEGHEERIRELESLAEIPSEDKLMGVRTRRDQGWHFIRTKLQKGSWDENLDDFTKGQEIGAVYEDSVQSADDLADKMRIEAAKVGEKNKHLSDIESAKKKIIELELDLGRLNDEYAKCEVAWIKLWEPSGIVPLTPREMKEWLGKHSHIKEMVQELVKTKAIILDLEGKKAQYKLELIAALSPFMSIAGDKTLDGLLSIAEKHQKKISADLNKRTNLESSIVEIKQKVITKANQKTIIKTKIGNWEVAWAQAINGTTITESTLPGVAESLLEKYEKTVQAYDELMAIEKEQGSVKRLIDLFAEKVNTVLQIVPIKIDRQNDDIAVNQLYAALQAAQQDKVRITNLNEQLKKLQTTIKQASIEMDESESILKGLINQAKCDNIEELEQIEKTFTLKKTFEANIQNYYQELLQLGNGRALKDLIEEAGKIEQDSIAVELEEIDRKLDEIEPVRSQLEQDHGVVKKEYEEKIQGANTASVSAEQQKESLLAQVANLTEQYIQLKLASTLLHKGIEHYRNQNQDPILKSASALFARLTLQSFAGLTVDYDDKDQPVLMGVRANGDKVALDGMSDGTIDQLYLSLRVASIEKYATENESIPFIVDDILVHFDDIRSKETLKILLELSQKTQIIFFTHHVRLIEIMKEIAADNAYQLTELNSKEGMMV